MREILTTAEKALALNLDSGRYGTFAEIGAGQEVGRWFFRVGGAAGTIAKTMSAYDKKVSDAIYGSGERYVSSGRLLAMLDHEYELLTERLDKDRGARSSFFAFADTVSAQNYKGDANCHGWMGIRFQTDPLSETSQLLLHTRMLDRDALMQHEALGILGVNLIYGVSHYHEMAETLLESLVDNLGSRRIEIDMVEFSGPAFADVDHRVMSLRLVEHGLSPAAMFSASGRVHRPSEVLYKRPVLIQRGRFRPPTKVHVDIQHKALERFCSEADVEASRVVSLLDISVRELKETEGENLKGFIDRIEALTAGNQSVLITDCSDYYLVAEYLARYEATQIALPLGVANFRQLMKEERYAKLSGGVLEAMGRLFGAGVRIYVYPMIDAETGKRETIDSLALPKEVQTLYAYLLEKQYVTGLEGLPDDLLRVTSDEILEWIRSGDARWEKYVEEGVARAIREQGLFGYQKP